MEVQKYLDLQYAKRPATLSMERVLSGEMAFADWRSAVRVALKGYLGAFPERVPLNIEKHEKIQMPGVDMRRITYFSEEGLETPAYVLRPEGAEGNLPAVVAITGHGYGVKDCVGLLPDGTIDPSEEGDYTHKFALRLCQRGFLVIAPEPLGFGELRLPEDAAHGDGHSSCDRINSVLTMMGRSLGGVRVLQAMRAIDVLKELGGVDENRIGMMGISGGGLVTAFATALDERISATVVSGYANTFKDSVMAMHHCVDNFFLGIVNDLELPDILAAICPRPMLWEAGDRDPIFPLFAVREARRQVLRIYEREGDGAEFLIDAFEGDHQISGKMAYDFLWRALCG